MKQSWQHRGFWHLTHQPHYPFLEMFVLAKKGGRRFSGKGAADIWPDPTRSCILILKFPFQCCRRCHVSAHFFILIFSKSICSDAHFFPLTFGSCVPSNWLFFSQKYLLKCCSKAAPWYIDQPMNIALKQQLAPGCLKEQNNPFWRCTQRLGWERRENWALKRGEEGCS